MEAPVKKKRGRPKKTDQGAATNSTTPAGTSIGMTSTAALTDDLSSHPYRYVTDIGTGNETVTANDGLEGLFENIARGPDLTSVFHKSHERKMIDQIAEYNARGPSPTQCNDSDWNKMMDFPASDQSTEAQPHLYGTPQALHSSPPALNTVITNTIEMPAPELVAGATASPATPHSASRAAEALEASCTPPSMKVPKASQLSDFNSAGLTGEDQSEKSKFSDSKSNGSSVEGFAEPQNLRPETPLKQSLGSPFAPATAPVRQAHARLNNMFNGSSHPGHQQHPMNNTSMSSPIPRTQNHVPTGSRSTEQMPSMSNPRYQGIPVNFKSTPTPAMFLNSPQFNNILHSNPAMLQNAAPSRAPIDVMGPRATLRNLTPEQQMHYQQQLHMQNRQHPGTVNPQFLANANTQNWISSQINNTPSPPDMTPRHNGYDFDVPTPSGSLGGVVQRRSDHDMNMGQKRSASQMSQGDVEGDKVQDPFGSPTMAQRGNRQQGRLFPQNQNELAMLMHNHQRTIRQVHMQAAIIAQARNQMRVNQGGSPMQVRAPGRSELEAEQRTQMVMQSQGQSTLQVSPSPQMRSVQQQRQGQQGVPQKSINTPVVARSTPSGATAGPQASPTPAPRRRATVLKPEQNLTATSPQASTPRGKKVQSTPTKKRTQVAPGGGQPKTPTGTGQASTTQMIDTAGHMPVGKTPSNEIPLNLRAHLPTPQRPISTGACPNTINETLAETNARTAPGLNDPGAPVSGHDPNWNPSSAEEYTFGFDLPGEVPIPGFGTPLGNMSFNSPMGFAMPSGTNFNTNTDANSFGNMNMFPNMYQADSHTPQHVSTPANLQNSVLNSGNGGGAQNPSISYAETVMSRTLTPVINHLATPNINNRTTATIDVPTNLSLESQPNQLANSAPGADIDTGALPPAMDGPADLTFEGLFLPTGDEIDKWTAEFDENAPFNPADWGV